MTLTYLDQNALINVGRKASDAEFRRKLDATIASGQLTIVVSSWHLIETANTRNLENAIKLADFIDSLKPAWLLERNNIQFLEMKEDFYKFARLEYKSEPRVVTRSAALRHSIELRTQPDSTSPQGNLLSSGYSTLNSLKS